MAGASGFVRVATDLRTFLMAVEGFDRRVQVHDPEQAQGGQPGLTQRPGLPPGARRRFRPGKGAAHAVFTAHLAHAKPRGIDRVSAQGADVAVTVLTGKDGQRDRAQQIIEGGRVVARKHQRAGVDPVVEQARRGQKLAEENQLPQRRHRRVSIPCHMKAPPVGVHGQWERRRGLEVERLTLPVRCDRSDLHWHTPFQQPFATTGNSPNCFFKGDDTPERLRGKNRLKVSAVLSHPARQSA